MNGWWVTRRVEVEEAVYVTAGSASEAKHRAREHLSVRGFDKHPVRVVLPDGGQAIPAK